VLIIEQDPRDADVDIHHHLLLLLMLLLLILLLLLRYSCLTTGSCVDVYGSVGTGLNPQATARPSSRLFRVPLVVRL
jgi:hypothetical protein